MESEMPEKSGEKLTGPRLTVPTRVILDKTPTPTKLLQSIDEIGLFVDDDDDIDDNNEESRQKKVDALKDRLVENPFDEHFRKATLLAKEGAVIATGKEESVKQDEVLNTPQIITSEYPTPSVVLTSESRVLASRSNSLISVKTSRPIFPASSSDIVQQLFLRWPGAESSSDSKDCEQVEPEGSKKRKPSLSSQNVDDRRQELLERNRAAACRSRAKKKNQMKNYQEQNSKLIATNKALLRENNLLKEENAKLKETLQLHKFCPVSINLETSKIFAGNSKVLASNFQTVTPIPKLSQVKIIPFDPKEILRLQSEQVVHSHVRLMRINSDQLKEDNVAPTGFRDILQEAAEHILQEDNQPVLHQAQLQQHQPQQLSSLGGVIISAGGQDQPQHDLVISSPGFVRVTPNYISVKSPLAKRAQKVKKTET